MFRRTAYRARLAFFQVILDDVGEREHVVPEQFILLFEKFLLEHVCVIEVAFRLFQVVRGGLFRLLLVGDFLVEPADACDKRFALRDNSCEFRVLRVRFLGLREGFDLRFERLDGVLCFFQFRFCIRKSLCGGGLAVFGFGLHACCIFHILVEHADFVPERFVFGDKLLGGRLLLFGKGLLFASGFQLICYLR